MNGVLNTVTYVIMFLIEEGVYERQRFFRTPAKHVQRLGTNCLALLVDLASAGSSCEMGVVSFVLRGLPNSIDKSSPCPVEPCLQRFVVLELFFGSEGKEYMDARCAFRAPHPPPARQGHPSKYNGRALKPEKARKPESPKTRNGSRQA